MDRGATAPSWSPISASCASPSATSDKLASCSIGDRPASRRPGSGRIRGYPGAVRPRTGARGRAGRRRTTARGGRSARAPQPRRLRQGSYERRPRGAGAGQRATRSGPARVIDAGRSGSHRAPRDVRVPGALAASSSARCARQRGQRAGCRGSGAIDVPVRNVAQWAREASPRCSVHRRNRRGPTPRSGSQPRANTSATPRCSRISSRAQRSGSCSPPDSSSEFHAATRRAAANNAESRSAAGRTARRRR